MLQLIPLSGARLSDEALPLLVLTAQKPLKDRKISARDRSNGRLDPDDVHNPGEIGGQDEECYLDGCFRELSCQEVGRFQRAERVFDGLLARGVWIGI